MKIFYLIIISISILIFDQQRIFAEDLKQKAEEMISAELGKNSNLEFQKFSIPQKIKSKIENSVKQKFFKDFVYVWKVKNSGKLTHYAVLDNVYGKSLPITFLVLFDLNGNIISTSIVKYREPYGGGVTNKNWNEQFSGKNSGSSYEIGKDISGISGATISVRSVTSGIKKLSMLIKEIESDL